MAFADHYPLTVFEAGYQASRQVSDAATEHQEKVFFPAVKRHLDDLRNEERLGAVGGICGRDLWFARDWNEMVVSGTFSAWLVSFITSLLYHTAHVEAERGSVFDPESRLSEISPARRTQMAWENLCDLLDRGTTDHRFRLDVQLDGKTGDRCQIAFTDWKGTLLRWNGSDMEPAQDVGAIPLAEIEIDCPSGQLILSDIISVADDAFHGAIDLGNRRYGIASLNSDQGCINYSRIVASEFNVVEVATDNTTVVVHRQGDRILVSERWADEELRLDDADGDVTVAGWDKVGRFSCDRFTVVVVDRLQALDMLAGKGVSDPSTTLDAWIADECEEVVTMQVAPGRYRIRFGPGFSQRFDRIEAGVPNGPEPWMIMEPIA